MKGRLAVLVLALLGWTATAAVAQTCTIKMYTVNFGTITPGTYAYMTDFESTCTGTPNKVVRVCIRLPPNDDGKYRLYNGTRTGQILTDYRTKDTRRSMAEGPWTLDVALSASGSGMARLPVEVAISPTTMYNLPADRYQAAFKSTPFAQYAYRTATTCDALTGAILPFTPPVSATLDPFCYVATSPLDFGEQTLTQPATASTTVTVTCDVGTNYTLTIDNGRNASGKIRRMIGVGSFLPYDLYRDARRTLRWGSEPGEAVAGQGTGSPVAHVLYGQIPVPQPAPPPGIYSDVVQLTIAY